MFLSYSQTCFEEVGPLLLCLALEGFKKNEPVNQKNHQMEP